MEAHVLTVLETINRVICLSPVMVLHRPLFWMLFVVLGDYLEDDVAVNSVTLAISKLIKLNGAVQLFPKSNGLKLLEEAMTRYVGVKEVMNHLVSIWLSLVKIGEEFPLCRIQNVC